MYVCMYEGGSGGVGGSNTLTSPEISVSLSFLQLYRETIQDLLAPPNPSNAHSAADDNLLIREDPVRCANLCVAFGSVNALVT